MAARRSRWLSWAKILVAVGLLAFVFLSGKIDLGEVQESLRTRWPYLVAAVAGVALVFAFGILRWWLLLVSQGIDITFRETFTVSFIGYFWNMVMPGAVGGDLVKAYYVARRRPGKRIEAVSTIALDRLIGLFAMLTISGAAALIVPEIGFGHDPKFEYLSKAVLILVGLGAVGTATVLIFDFRRFWFLAGGDAGPVLAGIRRIYNSIWLYREKKLVLLLAYLCSIGAHTCNIVIHVFLARALGVTGMSPAMYIYVIPIALVGNGLPIAPGGWGVGEYWYDFLFEIATGAAKNQGSEIALLMHLSFNFWNLLGFFAYLGHRSEVDEARQLAEAEGEGEPEPATDGEAPSGAPEEADPGPREGDRDGL